ncbi:HlyD family efflux transporter periplasmic adaptor subunit [Hoyosella subflava]|uniref:HlyD family efflux transporter periplasmic adaptor subunit n=1 Tax=Hoyosella subflava TaxID=639313 RepID=UPI0013054094|nr:HlyD family efflux transporter periplasmic adaptor subunit [Hoyosella subflava]
MQNLAPKVARNDGIDRFDEAALTTPIRAWIGLLACGLLAAGVLTWSLTARVDVTTSAPAVSLVDGAVYRVESAVDGYAEQSTAAVGDDVSAGDQLGVVRSVEGEEFTLIATVDGTVLAAPDQQGEAVQAGQSLYSLERTNGARQLRLFLTPPDAEQVSAGTEAVIRFPGRADIRGSVTRVGLLPLTSAEVVASLGSAALADLLVSSDSVISVWVEPVPGASLPAPDPNSEGGRVATVTLILDTTHPIGYVL